ncbi:adenylosuccinate synthase [Saccharothrix saharensis]|uniref:Adenylosuccinate synthetase n=1 Tax=Saccharothrix saharensis TaxID=571190 RepID=A0A543J4Q5_9PSEU|nr:adenylosuccinate synthetase [Saccharothrix saharensis]TQM77816.1 adenylosuccinate synthase [Saccharothrix saharensis]
MDGHIIVVGLGFGDEGKGAVVDALCHDGPVTSVVRFNGGAQAAHNVVVGDRHHTFSQFGSGTLAGVPTHLSRHVLVEPIALAGESRELAQLGVPDPLRLLTVDADALLTTPIHVAANRAREDARGHARHGSCGKGIGETTWYGLLADRGAAPGDVVEDQVVLGAPGAPPTVGDCAHPAVLRAKLDALARFYEPLIGDGPSVDDLVSLYRDFAGAVRITTGDEVGRLADRGRLVFEGAQGVLLDQWRGFHPHTTWSTVTPDNARDLLGHRPATVVGVTRTYQTRHGAGPFPTEDREVLARFPERHNDTGRYQGAWRAGHLDAVLLRYAIDACGGVDALAVTHLDAHDLQVATRYDAPLPATDLTAFLTHRAPTLVDLPDPVTWLETHLDVPVLVTGAGPDRTDYAVRAPARR